MSHLILAYIFIFDLIAGAESGGHPPVIELAADVAVTLRGRTLARDWQARGDAPWFPSCRGLPCIDTAEGRSSPRRRQVRHNRA